MVRAAPILLGLVAVAGCSGGGDERAEWAGPPRASATGVVDATAFNRYADEAGGDWTRSAIATAEEFARLEERDAAAKRIEVRGSGETRLVAVTLDGLEDDSVRAVRYTLRLARDGEVWHVRSARWSQRCWPGRGHEDFSPALCV